LLGVALRWFNVPDPFAPAFAATFEIVNQSDQGLFITPIGAVGPDGARFVLPQYPSYPPTVLPAPVTRISVTAHSTVRITYDWDDINFSEVAVESARGEVRQLVVDPQPTVGQYRPPGSPRYEIESFEQLDPISPIVAEAFQRTPLPDWLLGATSITLFSAWWFVRRHSRARIAA
jgi:hypothetical protein